ncbi:hypothetical protein Y919_12200 [Caloranaerobacter azorensis H53214]|uniref:Uncharacterized protein n=1 Tax=Caloranaerobacter azorensis H53214 TaxID=1156417 RepID=A0A096BF77_9FIRM|nr:DUF190 domain-containing protein [Caloranaerobacter azorensis]KGG79413.1 hypothetical protein Y919_12200 [Caloranaerobacter azorensis H53214]
MIMQSKGKLLKIYISEFDKYNGQLLYHLIVEQAKILEMAGITVYRGIEGFGGHHNLHTVHIFRLSDNLPIVLEIIDSEEKIDKFISHIEQFIKDGLMITQENINIIKFDKKR